MQRRERLIALLFVLPATALIGLFVVWPAVHALGVSATSARLTQPEPAAYCGADNFQALWQDPEFSQAARNTAWFTVLVVPLQVILAMALAIWVNRPGRTIQLLRLAVFLPTALSLAVLSVLWTLMYEPETASGSGLINALLGRLNLPAQPFLTSPTLAMPAIALMSIWQGVGLQMLVLWAALQQIPRHLYDAARLDGAGAWSQFRSVTLPGVAPTGAFVVMIHHHLRPQTVRPTPSYDGWWPAGIKHCRLCSTSMKQRSMPGTWDGLAPPAWCSSWQSPESP